MKQKDIILVIVVVFVSGVLALIISNFLITAPKNRQTEVEVVTPISTELTKPDSRYFNDKSINPTQNIQIGNQDNNQPF